MHCQKKVIFFSSFMGWIFLPFLFPYKCCSSCSVVTVSNIGIWYLFSKQFFDKFVDFRIFYNPEMMTKPIFCYKIIFRFFLADNIFNNIVNLFNRRIREKYRFNIGIIYTDMYHSVLFFISTGKFMLFDNTI